VRRAESKEGTVGVLSRHREDRDSKMQSLSGVAIYTAALGLPGCRWIVLLLMMIVILIGMMMVMVIVLGLP
jgi:hypothetical protein